MSETVRIDLDTTGLRSEVESLREELTSLVENDLNPLAASVRGAFQTMSETVLAELTVTAEAGKSSIKDMVDAILLDLARVAADELIRAPLENILGGGIGGETAGAGVGRSGTQTASLLARTLQQANRNG